MVTCVARGARRNCVFCGDVVPRFPGNSTYIKEVFSKFVPLYQSINAIVEKVAGKTDDLLHAKINDLVNNLGKFDHCSKIIYYENPEGEPELLSAIDFKNKTLAAALTANDTKFNTKIENLEAKILKKTPFRFRPAGSRWEGDGDFDGIFEFLNDAHGVLPYASESTPLMPCHIFHKRRFTLIASSLRSTPRPYMAFVHVLLFVN